MQLKSFFSSQPFKWTLIVLLQIIVVLGVFRLGVVVGFHKATFSLRWGENYHHLFGGPRRGWGAEFRRDDYISGSGIVGTVLKVATSTLTIRGKDNVERSVAVDANTVIRRQRDNATAADIVVDEPILVIGSPSSTGQIEAKFIRLFTIHQGR